MKLAVLLVAAVVSAGCDHITGRTGNRYQMRVATAAPAANEDKVWVLDTATGQITMCFETGATIRCLPAATFPEKK